MATATPPPKTFSADELASQYGFAASFFNTDGELKGLLDRAVREQWSADRFKAGFVATNWYRARHEPWRQWIELNSRDPAEASRQRILKGDEVDRLANQMGVNLTSDVRAHIVDMALGSGYSAADLQNMVGAHLSYQRDKMGGQAGAVDARIRGLANDYGVTISDGDVAHLTQQMLSGQITDDALTSYAKNMAISKYAGMKGYLEQGFTVKQVASPYIQSYAQLMEKDPNSVQLNDPLVQSALQGTPDPKTGVPAMKSVYQFEQAVRQDSRWLQTANAHQQAESVATRIAQDWGLHS